MMTLPRRGLLKIALAIGVLRAGPSLAADSGLPGVETAFAADIETALRALLPKGLDIRDVGRAYLRDTRADDARHAELSRAARDMHAKAQGRPDVLQAHLAARIRDDFAGNRLTHVNRWILARTEAELCALCSGPRQAVPAALNRPA